MFCFLKIRKIAEFVCLFFLEGEKGKEKKIIFKKRDESISGRKLIKRESKSIDRQWKKGKRWNKIKERERQAHARAKQ